jgi:hypothetical protein
MELQEIYEWLGFAIFWLSVVFLSLIIVGALFKWIMNLLGKYWNNLWVIIEYLIYRKDFKEFVKDKQRHKRLKDGN